MNRNLRSTKSAQQIKDEQTGFLLEDIEQDIEEYKIIIETKNKQLADIKKVLQGVKNSYQGLKKENKQLKQYIANINNNNNNYNKHNNILGLKNIKRWFKKKKPIMK